MPATPNQPVQANMAWETYLALKAAAAAKGISQSQWMIEAVEAKLATGESPRRPKQER